MGTKRGRHGRACHRDALWLTEMIPCLIHPRRIQLEWRHSYDHPVVVGTIQRPTEPFSVALHPSQAPVKAERHICSYLCSNAVEIIEGKIAIRRVEA